MRAQLPVGAFCLSFFGALQFKNQWVWIRLSEATSAHSCLQLHLKLSLSIPISSKDFLVSIFDKGERASRFLLDFVDSIFTNGQGPSRFL